jgi:hypothetical protein
MSGLRIYMLSAIHSRGDSSGLMSDMGCFTDDVVNTLEMRKSSITVILLVGGGVVRSGWGGNGSWLFRKCSGVAGGDEPKEDETRVGDEWVEDGGKFSGSMSRSGIGGDTNGRRVIFKSINLSTALR